MNKVAYHINPHTGIPSVCRAKNGKCPYGGSSGSENHFSTFSEAQERAESLMEKKYAMLPVENNNEIKKIIDSKKRIDEKKMNALLASEDIIKEINTTSDEDVIAGVIQGELKFDGWKHIGAALQNDNLSKEYIDDVLIHYPEEFDDETRKLAASSHQLTHEDLVYVAENDPNDEVRAIALVNKRLKRDYITEILKTKSDEDLKKPPYSIIFTDWRNRENKLAIEAKKTFSEDPEFRLNLNRSRRTIDNYSNVKDEGLLIFQF